MSPAAATTTATTAATTATTTTSPTPPAASAPATGATTASTPPLVSATDDATTSAADADLELVMAQCGVSMETACELLNQADGDIVEAIAYHLNPTLAVSEAHKEAQEWALVGADEGDDALDEETRTAREVQAKLAELRDITTAKNAMLDAQMRARKAEQAAAQAAAQPAGATGEAASAPSSSHG